jgi:hypothetical protein
MSRDNIVSVSSISNTTRVYPSRELYSLVGVVVAISRFVCVNLTVLCAKARLFFALVVTPFDKSNYKDSRVWSVMVRLFELRYFWRILEQRLPTSICSKWSFNTSNAGILDTT